MWLGGMNPPLSSTPLIRAKRSKLASAGSDVGAADDKGVSTPPGHTQLTRMPSKASSTAIDFMNSRSAPFDAQYAALYGCPWMPEIEATVTMLPFDSRRCGSAAWVARNEPM